MSKSEAIGMLDRTILRGAAIDALKKLAPQKLVRNPVMFVTGVVAALVNLVYYPVAINREEIGKGHI